MTATKQKRNWRIGLDKLGCILVLMAGILGSMPAHAVIASCSAPNRFMSNGAWIVESPATFKEGTVLASINLVLNVRIDNFRIAATGQRTDMSIAYTGSPANPPVSYPSFNANWNTVPVTGGVGATGLGGRLSFIGASSTAGLDYRYYVTLPSVFTPNPSPPDLVYIYKQPPSGVQRVNGYINYLAKYELVILDPVAYAASDPTQINLGAQRGPQMNMFINVYDDNGSSGGGVNCFTGTSTSNTLASLPSVPSLPKDMATCKFDVGSLNQSVDLNPANQSQIAAQGDPRTVGTVGEKTFNLIASACSKGATYSVYFTDVRQPASQQAYLTPTTGKVGVRLYQGGETQPITFGPAPIGSSLPPQTPLRYGSSTAAANASYTMPFTAQYVRLPGVQAAPPGSMTAQATVTIVYP